MLKDATLVRESSGNGVSMESMVKAIFSLMLPIKRDYPHPMVPCTIILSGEVIPIFVE